MGDRSAIPLRIPGRQGSSLRPHEMPHERTLSCSDSSPRVGRNHGKAGIYRALRAHDGSHRGWRGRPVLPGPLLGAADGQRRDRPGVRGVLFQVPEAFLSAAPRERSTQLGLSPTGTRGGCADLSQTGPRRSVAGSSYGTSALRSSIPTSGWFAADFVLVSRPRVLRGWVLACCRDARKLAYSLGL